MRIRTTVLLASGLTLAAVLLVKKRDTPPQVSPSTRDTQDLLVNQRSKGSPTAPIVVFEMSDFQCPFCRRHAVETFPLLDSLYIATGKVRWTFVNFPISQIHPNAVAAAEFAMCAAKADKFWPVHDLIFTHQDEWKSLSDPGPFLLTLADSAKIRRRDITPCLTNGETRELVRQEAEEVARVGIQSTPSFVIEGKLLRGAAPAETFRAIFDSIYTEKLRGRTNPE